MNKMLSGAVPGDGEGVAEGAGEVENALVGGATEEEVGVFES